MRERSIHEGGLMTPFGVEQALESAAYDTALAYLEALFADPGVGKADKITLMCLRSYLVECLLHLGRETQAIEVDRLLLRELRPADTRIGSLHLWCPLYVYLLEQDQDRLASSELTEFIWEAAQARAFRKRRTLPCPATYGQLAAALNDRLPPSEQEGAREAWHNYVELRRRLRTPDPPTPNT